MKCKTCGAEVRTGTEKCPHCNTDLSGNIKFVGDEFKWNVQDFPKPKKKTEVSIDWSAGKIFDKSEGKVYSQAENVWKEPEEVKELFVFDKKNEEFQEVLDKQVDSISSDMPEKVFNEAPRMFDLPSSMDMGVFDALINDDIEVIIPGVEGREGTEEKSGEATSAWSSMGKTEISRADVSKRFRSVGDITVKKENSETAVLSSGLAETVSDQSSAADVQTDNDKEKEDEVVLKGLQKLMDAEKKFKQDMERVTFLAEGEAEKAEKVEAETQKLRFVPTISFRTIEDEYEAYREEKGIPRAVPEKNNDGGKEVQIKINEPSGTKVTVKTQEINLANAENNGPVRTQEVQLEKLRQGPKNVQVSVEVNAAKGNASVEVTRRHDGATVVRTIDDGQHEEQHTFEPSVAEVMPAQEKASSFWEKPVKTSKMTITDIFGPEARDIINGGKPKSEKKHRKNDDLSDSLILDIKPEDIAITDDQTKAIHMPSQEEIEETEEIEEIEEIQAPEDDKVTEESGESEAVEIIEAVAEDAEDAAVAEDTAPESDESAGTEEGDAIVISADAEDHVDIEDDIDTENDSDAENQVVGTDDAVNAEADVAEGARDKAAAAEDVTDKAADTDNAIDDSTTDGYVTKKIDREEIREEIKENSIAEKTEKARMGIVTKILIIILIVVLIGEFSIFGIKLFAPESGAAVFIERVENQIFSIFDGTDGKEGVGGTNQV